MGHWFQPQSPGEAVAIEALTGRSVDEIRRGQETSRSATERAEAIERAFLRDGLFPELLILFE